MKIPTNEGPVELTAEMVCRGMAFQDAAFDTPNIFDDDPSLYRDREAGMREVQEALAADVAAGSIIFLGCNPEIASRADCERYGVHGDAAAHGFARLRDGGAVDLRKRRPKGTVYEMNGARHLATADDGMMLAAGQTFVGLDADLARPEDVRRMCCGARETADWQDEKGDWQPARWRTCTLAIGDHEQREDLATGVKWAAKPSTGSAYPIVSGTGEGSSRAFLSSSPPKIRATWCDAPPWPPPPDRFVFHDGDPVREVVSIQGNAYHCECGAETPSDHAGTCKAPFWIREASLAAWCEWRRSGDVSAASKACYEARVGAGAVALLAWAYRLWAASPAGKRVAQERALVALVNAVPEGLDPVGWRAAVLGDVECMGDSKRFINWRALGSSVETAIRAKVFVTAYDERVRQNYRRAITPAAPVPRVRATWKTRSPVLAVDDGRDE